MKFFNEYFETLPCHDKKSNINKNTLKRSIHTNNYFLIQKILQNESQNIRISVENKKKGIFSFLKYLNVFTYCNRKAGVWNMDEIVFVACTKAVSQY
ncbi:hypothetical protein BpHYR1_046916 [Brachionus plicatilis]|uniref:Uncharacterized protein n=1 Tax=Brachionus plicatilis TaxID=10195 RepID=A0A3M7PD37_BRAPC|nr:hypothetical protein BpHYR1_046916 [Brachionus plicatilis]